MHNVVSIFHLLCFSFVIGGDGVVYEGRGWDYRPYIPRQYYYYADKAFHIGFVGNWEGEKTENKQLEW